MNQHPTNKYIFPDGRVERRNAYMYMEEKRYDEWFLQQNECINELIMTIL